MKKNPFLKDTYRFGPRQSQLHVQKQISNDESLDKIHNEDSLLLDGLDAQIQVSKTLQTQKELQKTENAQRPTQKQRTISDQESPSFIEMIRQSYSRTKERILYHTRPEKQTQVSDSHTVLKGRLSKTIHQPQASNYPGDNQKNLIYRPKESEETTVACDSYADLSFGDFSPCSKNIKNVPMTRSIITTGSASTDEKIPESKGDKSKFANRLKNDQEDKSSDKSQNQQKSDDFPEGKSQHNLGESGKRMINDQISDKKNAKLLQNSEKKDKQQEQSQFQQKSQEKKSIQCQEVRNSKNGSSRIRRSRSQSQTHINSNQKRLHFVIHQQAGQNQNESSIKCSLFIKPLKLQIDQDVASQKGEQNPGNVSDRTNTQSHYSTVSIHALDVDSTSSIYEYIKDKQNQNLNSKIPNQLPIMQKESQKQVKLQRPAKKKPPMNQSIDFNSIKSKSKSKNAFLPSKNNNKNLQDRLKQKGKKDFDNNEKLPEERLINRMITQKNLSSMRDLCLKMVLECESEKVHSMARELISCMSDIEGATNIARIQRKIMSKNLNKAKKQISTLRDLNLRYQSFLYQLCEQQKSKSANVQHANLILKHNYRETGATFENGKIVFAEQMVQEYIRLKRKQQLTLKDIQQMQKLKNTELKSLKNPNDPCNMILSSFSNEELIENLRQRSQTEEELTLKLVDFRNMMMTSYLGLCLEKYPNTIPQRLTLFEKRDEQMINAARQNGINFPEEFVNQSKRMLVNLKKCIKKTEEN